MTRRSTKISILLLLACSLSLEPAPGARAYGDGCHATQSTAQSVFSLAHQAPNYSKSQRHRGKKLSAGVWGGEHISLQVTTEGITVEYDCAHGKIPGGIFVNRQGHFVVVGTHVEEHGGPVGATESPNSYPVQFSGKVSGKRMKLTVKRSDTKKLIGTFTLIAGQEASLVKCR